MNDPSLEALFRTFRGTGAPGALAAVFDRTAPELGRVASYLAGGDLERAADLLQATWLTAITHAARWDETRPLLPWLLGVLANHARGQRRAARRTAPSPTAAVVLQELLASDDPVRASADAELGRLLAGALAEVPSPFREAVALHVQHGLTAKEIGEALGRPAGTVRTQIVRGLDRLRALLPAGLAGAGAVAAVLAAERVAGVRATVLAAVRPVPVAAGAWRWGLGAAGIVVAAIGYAAWPAHDAGVPPVVVAAAEPPPVAARVAAPAASVAPRELVRDEQEPGPAVRRPVRRITVHVRREQPPEIVAGEWVGLDGRDALVATNAAGDAVFDDVPPSLAHFVFLSGVDATTTVPAPRLPPPDEFAVETTIAVRGGVPLCVRVVDAVGTPVAGAEVEGNGVQRSLRRWLPIGRTDANGELRLRNQALGQYRARAPGHAPSAFASPEPAGADGSNGCVLELGARVAAVHGRVVDENGNAVAAELGTVEFSDSLLEPWFDATDAQGRFTFDWIGAGHVGIVARVGGESGTRLGLLRFDVPRREPVEIRLQRSARIDVTTAFADGTRAPGTMVRTKLLADGVFSLPFCFPHARSDGEGHVRLGGLLPGRWRVEVDYGQRSVTRTLELAPGGVATWDARAMPLRDLPLRLLDERGAPLHRWHVELWNTRNEPLGARGFTQEDGTLHQSTRYRLPPDEPVTIAVFDPEGFAASPDFPVHRVPAVLATGAPLDVVVPDRCRSAHHVRGRVVGVRGEPCRAEVRVVAPQAWWRGTSATTADDGAFRIGPLPPGRFAVVVRCGDVERRLDRIEIPVAGDLELGDVVVAPGVAVRAAPAARDALPDDLRLELVLARGGDLHSLRRGADGVFVATGVPPGTWVLRGSSRTHAVARQEVSVGAAAGDVVVALACVPAPTLRVEIPLLDDERAQLGWSGTVTLRRGTEDVVRRRVDRRFGGRVPSPLTVELAAPPGEYTVIVDLPGHHELRGTAELRENGGAALLAR